MSNKMTPMQEQYHKLKQENEDALLLFRMGDFYEAFYEDAEQVAKILGITLTGRGKGESRYAMAGIPYHALPNYLPKLSKAGVKVAIAEQTEEPVKGQLVDRQIVKIITPGTITDEKSLDESKNNFISSLYINISSKIKTFYFVYSDLTTGEFKALKTDNEFTLVNEVKKISPSQIIIDPSNSSFVKSFYDGYLEEYDYVSLNKDKAYKILLEQFQISSLDGFGLDQSNEIILPAAILINYLNDTQKTEVKHIRSINVYNYSNYMQLDSSTINNLELIYPINSNVDPKLTVFGVLNKCRTSMGQRKLRQFILNPLTNRDMLADRLETTNYFYNNPIVTDDFRESLNQVYDIERLAGKLGLASINPKEIFNLSLSLDLALNIIKEIDSLEDKSDRLSFLSSTVNKSQIEELIKEIKNTIKEEAPVITSEAGIFVDGFNSEIDELRSIRKNAKNLLVQIQKKEIEATKIPSLKVSFNKVFGYYIEVTRTHSSKVPENYIRKQTLANAERFITQELKELEEKILTAEDKLIQIEQNLFVKFVQKLTENLQEILHLADVISEIDVLTNFAYVARENGYSYPSLITEDKLEIENARHLVVETITKNFVENDTEFNKNSLIHILTGPNMSGKSTYIRQVALCILLAQIGSFVPADNMEFNIFDRIFTRVGASDNLAKGQSTFMVEMAEAANILNYATNKSLIVFDEVGRGTSTYDGVAIAWSIIEYIQDKLKSKTLFATHYHELVELEQKYKDIKNFNVEVDDSSENVIFKHKIISGGTDKSYGVHVAKLAGIPGEVVNRAEEILKSFEEQDNTKSLNKKSSNKKEKVSKNKKVGPKVRKIDTGQTTLF